MTILGLPSTSEICEVYILGKMTRLPFHKYVPQSSNFGDLIHSDVCCSINPTVVVDRCTLPGEIAKIKCILT